MLDILNHILRQRGLRWRKQLAELPVWTRRAVTIVDLAPAEQALLDAGNLTLLQQTLEQQGEFLFPALLPAIPSPLPPFRPRQISFPADDPFLAELATRMQSLLGGRPALCPDTEPMPDSAIILGTANRNRHSRRLAGLGLLHANGLIPGRGGYLWQTVCRAGQTLLVGVADSPETAAPLLEHLQQATGNGDTIRPLNLCVHGPDTARRLGSSEELLRSIAIHVSRHGETAATFSGMARCIIAAYDSGGPEANRDNGHCTIPNLVRLFSAYRYTGDRRFLQTFRAGLLGLVDYFLGTPGGASYPSDYDFYLGHLLLCWSQAEHDPLFSIPERLLITAFMLGSGRLAEKHLHTDHPIQADTFLHNHQTFSVHTLHQFATWFADTLPVADAARWQQEAENAFTSPLLRHHRQRENANSYRWIAPSHKIAFDLSRDPDGLDQDFLAKMVHAISISTDSLGLAVPYGDSEPFSGTIAQLDLLRCAAATGNRQALAIYQNCLDGLGNQGYPYLPTPGWGNLLAPELDPSLLRTSRIWEIENLASHVAERHQTTVPLTELYEKIAVRSGPDAAAQYLLFEPYSADSHSHVDQNSILAYNHFGRWGLVDNGYGKAPDLTDVAKAYATRETGPNCHNLLIFYDRDGAIIRPPAFCRVTGLQQNDRGFSWQSTLDNINGAVWTRKITLLLDDCLIIDDQVDLSQAHNIGRVECQLNAIGQLRRESDGWTLEQQGVATRIASHGDGDPAEKSYMTKGYQSVLGQAYPWADGPVHQLSRIASVDRQTRIDFFSTCTIRPI